MYYITSHHWKTNIKMKRRKLIKQLGAILIGLVVTAPFLSCNSSSPEKITFAISSDIHQDIMHDAQIGRASCRERV